MDGGAGHRLGLLLVTASAVAWSTAGLFTRLIPFDSWTMLLWRGLFGALGVFLFILSQERAGAIRQFQYLGWAGWLFAIVSAVGMLCFITSLTLTSVAHVSIIYGTVPFIAGAIAWLALKEAPSGSACVASAIALLGVVVMVGFGDEGSWTGDLLAFGMTLAMAAMMIISRRHQNIPTLAAACLSAILSAIMALPFAANASLTAVDILNLALFGLVNSAIGLALFTLGARLIPPVETALIGSLDAPLAPVWVWLAFGETPTGSTTLGGLLVFGAVAFHLAISARKSAPTSPSAPRPRAGRRTG